MAVVYILMNVAAIYLATLPRRRFRQFGLDVTFPGGNLVGRADTMFDAKVLGSGFGSLAAANTMVRERGEGHGAFEKGARHASFESQPRQPLLTPLHC